MKSLNWVMFAVFVLCFSVTAGAVNLKHNVLPRTSPVSPSVFTQSCHAQTPQIPKTITANPLLSSLFVDTLCCDVDGDVRLFCLMNKLVTTCGALDLAWNDADMLRQVYLLKGQFPGGFGEDVNGNRVSLDLQATTQDGMGALNKCKSGFGKEQFDNDDQKLAFAVTLVQDAVNAFYKIYALHGQLYSDDVTLLNTLRSGFTLSQ